LTSNDIVYQGIIRGKPVASAHKNRVGIINGHSTLVPTAEWETWFASAINQTERNLARCGHRVERELQVTKSGQNKGKPSKNSHGQCTNVTNPLFTNGKYRVIVWYFHPMNVYARDDAGQVKTTKATKRKPAEPRTKPFQKLDTDNVFKGVCDALEQGGVIGNDKDVAMAYTVAMPVLEDDAEPYVAIQVKRMDYNNEQDWVVPYPCPVQTTDTALYMPRIYDGGHDWFVVKTQERNYRRMTGLDKAPITKAVCRRCTALIGVGHVQTEIWWNHNPDRWGNEVVLVCGTCGAAQFDKVKNIEGQIDRRTLAVCKASGIPIHDVPTNEHDDRLLFNAVRQRVDDALRQQYREQYCLVSTEDLPTTSYTEIGLRWARVQDNVNGQHSQHSTRGNSDGRESDSGTVTSGHRTGATRAARPMAGIRLLAARNRTSGAVGAETSGD
jgi:hypothetical protein